MVLMEIWTWFVLREKKLQVGRYPELNRYSAPDDWTIVVEFS